MCVYLVFLSEFRRLLDHGHSDPAITLAESMVAHFPDSALYREHWSLALWHQDNYQAANQVLEQAQSLGALSPYALLMLVHCLAAQGSRRAALQRLRTFLTCEDLSNEDSQLLARKFGELSELGRAAEANTLIRNIDFRACCKTWQREVVFGIAHAVGDRVMLCLLASLDKNSIDRETNPNQNLEN